MYVILLIHEYEAQPRMRVNNNDISLIAWYNQLLSWLFAYVNGSAKTLHVHLQILAYI